MKHKIKNLLINTVKSLVGKKIKTPSLDAIKKSNRIFYKNAKKK